MNFPSDLQYSRSHEWVKMLDNTTALLGISDYAQDALGDVVFISLPPAGDGVVAGEPFTEVESVKAVSEVISPVTGIIEETNEALNEAPEILNEDCYAGWIVKVRDISSMEELLNAEEYEAFLASIEED